MGIGSSIRYSFRDAFRCFTRHFGMTLASIITVAISLLILGSTLLLVLNTQYIADTMESQVEINVFLHEHISRQDALAFGEKLKAMDSVNALEFIPKEDALAMMEERFGEDVDITKALGGNNPLPDSYRVKATDVELVGTLAAAIEGMEEVESLRYGKDLVDKLVAFTNWVRNAGVAIIVGILFAGLFLISTTIRLTVFARKKEINIMKYVGATNWFIRAPFFLEGMLIGLIGGLLAVVSLYFGYATAVTHATASIPFFSLMTDKAILYQIFSGLLIGGTILGALGSMIAVRKYLNV